MRLVVTDRAPAEVAGDVVVGLFRPRGRGWSLPFATHLNPDAQRIAARDEDALTWFETRRMRAPRALLASLGSERRAPGLGGHCGDLDEAVIGVAERHDLRALGAEIERACNRANVKRVVLAAAPDDCDLGLVLEGMMLRAYQCNEWRDHEPTTTIKQVTICVAADARDRRERELREVEEVTRATNFARELGDLPSNVGTPHGVVERARAGLAESSLEVRVIEMAEAHEYEMGLFCAVARGSEHPGCILELEHNAAEAEELPTLVLLGKGITHDLGGYNIKTSPGVYALTHDKCGATAVIGAMRAIARLQLPAHVVAILPLAENSLDRPAYKPGDILTAMDSTTVFVENTDAEGRLVLADCLCRADHYEPDAVVDLATLTRASANAMGDPYASLFCNDDELRDLLMKAGQASDDLLWPMPIHDQHEREIGHYKADIKNMGGGSGSASSAAAFLRHFADWPWAHIDLAGKAAWEHPRDYLGEGATGFGCRLLVEFVRGYAAARADESGS